MPSKSKAQAHLMAAVAHNPAFAKKVGIPQSVGKDFNQADKGRKFKEGGAMQPVDMKKNPGLANLPTEVRNKMGYMKKGGMADDSKEDMKMDKAQDKAMIKKAFRQHDAQEHKGGKGTSLKLAKGGMDMKKKSVNPAMAMMAARAMRTPSPAPMAAPMPAPSAPMGMGMKSGGRTPVKGEHPVQKKDKKGAQMIKMASGGLSAGHKKANGCATKGLTKGTMVKMSKGGKYC
jgi:hypothetical protein